MSHPTSFLDRYATPLGIVGIAALLLYMLWLVSLIGADDTEALAYIPEEREALLANILRDGERKLELGATDGSVTISMETAAKLVELRANSGEPLFGIDAQSAAAVASATGGLTVDPRYPLAEIPEIPDTPERNAELIELAKDVEQVEAGEMNFQALCMQCHGGPDLPGDNPTVIFDDRWFYVNTPSQIETLLYKGILEKGMPPWEGVLTPEMSGQIVAYILANKRD